MPASVWVGTAVERYPTCNCACCTVNQRRIANRQPPQESEDAVHEEQHPEVDAAQEAAHQAAMEAYEAYKAQTEKMACMPLYESQEFLHQGFADCNAIHGVHGTFCERDENDVMSDARQNQIDMTHFCFHECVPSFDVFENVGPGGECISARMISKLPAGWQEAAKKAAAEHAVQVAINKASLLGKNRTNASIAKLEGQSFLAKSA
eukprot:TRINITY_DN17390_c0_g1_i1.p1 TRINITY_DN17390_c0_g1~~TRINITY_DN17390_c0_g1_i1.p1  ORF type:complete len:206 (-),score=47.65 TRINITY_DN17390_c0_g1_i1:41-658(-)